MFPPNTDTSHLFDSSLVDDLLARGQAVRPLPIPTAPPVAAQASPEPVSRLQKALSMALPLFAIGQALGGSANAGAATLHGYQQHQALEQERRHREGQLEIQRQQQARLAAEQTRITQVQEAERIAREQAREEQRQRAVASYILDVNKRAREFTSKSDHDRFVSMADALGAQNYGMRPGAVIASSQFVPEPMRERALKVLDRYRKSAPNGQLSASSGDSPAKRIPLDSVSVQFDIDGDGEDETIPFRKLEELAGEAFYGPTGERIVPNQPAPIGTYGQTFPQARGTVFADKPLPTNAHGQPDYGKALRDLHALSAGTPTSAADRRQARVDAQTQARDRLYDAILNGDTDDALRRSFSESFTHLGLSFRAEVARIRKEILGAGEHGVPSDERELMTTDDVFARGRRALTGSSEKRPTSTSPTPPTAGRGVNPARPAPAAGGPPSTVRGDYLKAREKALQVLDAEAQRRGLPPGSITEEQVATFLANPENRKRLQGR